MLAGVALNAATPGFVPTMNGMQLGSNSNPWVSLAVSGAITANTANFTGAISSATGTSVGNGAGSALFELNGGASGSNNGSVYGVYNNGAFVGGLGNTSAVIGGAFSGNIMLYSAAALHLNATSIIFDSVFRSAPFTVSTLPAAGTAGRRAHVTDATSFPSFGGSLTGGGSTIVPVFDNGSAWIAA